MAEPETAPPGAPAEHDAPAYVVLVNYTRGELPDRTRDALRAWGGPYGMIDLDPDDRRAYGRALAAEWRLRRTLVLVAPDIVPAPGMIQDLIECTADWCAHAYHVGGGTYTTGLGLCKISARVTAEHPGLAQLAAEDAYPVGPPARPYGLGAALENRLLRSGCWMHEHAGTPVNLSAPRPGVHGG